MEDADDIMAVQEQKRQEQLFWRKENECDNCNKHSEELKLCTRCRRAKYCNKICQTAHWSIHKIKCKEHKSNGPERIDASYGEEAALSAFDHKCVKNPGHHQFISIDKFNAEHLPPGCRDNKIVDLVRAQADLTVRVSVKYVSERRPEIDPNSEKPYPFSAKKGYNDQRNGTGWIDSIVKYSPELEDSRGETCKCKECLNSPTPKTQFAHIYIYTATHVVYDYLEAPHTTCYLFYDRAKTPTECSGLVTLTHPSYVFTDINTDVCQLIYTTHDLDLADMLEKMIDDHALLTYIVNIKYFSSLSEKLDLLQEDESLYDIACDIAIPMKDFKTSMNVWFPVQYELLNCDILQEQSTMSSYIETMFNFRRHFVQKIIDKCVEAVKQSDVESSHDFFKEPPNHCLEIKDKCVEAEKQSDVESSHDFFKEPPNHCLEIKDKCVEAEKQSDVESSHDFFKEPPNHCLEIKDKFVEAEKQSDVESSHDFFKEPPNHCLEIKDKCVEAEKQSDVESSHDFFKEPANRCLEVIKDAQNQLDKHFRGCKLEPSVHLIKEQADSFFKYLLDQLNGINVEPNKTNLSKTPRGAYENLTHIIKHLQNLTFSTNLESNKQIHEFPHPLPFIYDKEKLLQTYNHFLEQIRQSNLELEKQKPQPQIGSADDSLRTLTIIVSHPHGCSKQVSIGHCTKQDVVSEPLSKLAYTTATCPGSSGAHVCLMERSHLCQYVHVGNSQRNTKLNISGSPWDVPID